MLPLEPWIRDFFEVTDACWPWTRGRHKSGYGFISGNKGRPSPRFGNYAGMFAHRAVWTMIHGSIPPGMCVLHKCDNPPCVRPDHLFLGTMKDNTRDMMAKGRSGWQKAPWPGFLRRGAAHRLAKLTEADVVEIRRLYAAGVNGVQLSRQFGVSNPVIYSLLNRKTWAHVP